MNDVKELSKKQKIIINSLSSIGTVFLYATGINLSRTFIDPTVPIIVTTTISFISPYLLKNSTTFLLKRHNQKNKRVNRS